MTYWDTEILRSIAVVQLQANTLGIADCFRKSGSESSLIKAETLFTGLKIEHEQQYSLVIFQMYIPVYEYWFLFQQKLLWHALRSSLSDFKIKIFLIFKNQCWQLDGTTQTILVICETNEDRELTCISIMYLLRWWACVNCSNMVLHWAQEIKCKFSSVLDFSEIFGQFKIYMQFHFLKINMSW